MAAYENIVDSIKARLKEARKSVKDTYTDKDKKKDGKGMYASYTAAMDEISSLENRLRVAEAKVPKKPKVIKPSEMSDAQRARQGLMPKKVAESLKKKKEKNRKNKKASPSPVKKKNQSTGEDWADSFKSFFGIDPKKIGGYKTQASKDQAAKKEKASILKSEGRRQKSQKGSTSRVI